MTGKLKTFTVAHGADLMPAAALGFPCAWLAYTIENGELRMTARTPGRGGLMGLYTTSPLPKNDDLRRLAQAIGNAVRQRQYGGVLLDLPDSDEALTFAARLCPLLTGMGIPLFLPIELGEASRDARLILPSAISGGSFDEMLARFTGFYPPSRLCLDLIRTRHDFSMPSPDADGHLLGSCAFEELLRNAGQSYYARELCCRYFTYRAEDGKPHFVMFDDVETARRKVELARDAGLFAVFALYAEGGREIQEIFG